MTGLRPIMLCGTGSDVGKSVLATALCRIFKQDGYAPAPFKAQNMALNSYVTSDGLEIGRAQAVQAEAAGLECQVDMNPILLKPQGDHTSQVVLNGRPIGNYSAQEYFRSEGREHLQQAAHNAFDKLAQMYHPIVMEGAGSISEINLKKQDIVNLAMARYAGASVILVADIDRGGVFASCYGSIALQYPEDRKLIKGIIVNKFRGDMRLFEDGRKMLEEVCKVPVLGIIPYFNDIHIEEEDSVDLIFKNRRVSHDKINIAVILLKYISNFTDFDILERDPRVNLFYTNNIQDIAQVDIIIIPGSKSTLEDLYELRRDGCAQAIMKAHENGKTIMGICGGFQMLGEEVLDPNHVEGDIDRLPGLGLLPMSTTMDCNKATQRVEFSFEGYLLNGYEIHNGKSVLRDGTSNYGKIVNRDKVYGTYVHGILDNISFIDILLAPYAGKSQEGFNLKKYKETQYDLLANHVRSNLDMDCLYSIMKGEV
ncbi:cobyric acid synthase [Prevotella sp. DNF00663]|uniref:cobyric acid synthase n=1 Tax=Prevotella sp. DNF00663 TaxID=1384078 RepID=UPI000783B2CB|nr:cobyric acid synthase [Prevotella sp. DNF00663]